MCMSLSLVESAPQSSAARDAWIVAGFDGGQLSLLDLRSGGKMVREVTVANNPGAPLTMPHI